MSQTPKPLTAVPDLPEFYKPSSQLEMVELRYSAIPGQPSIIYWDSSNDTVVSICPTPQLGLVSVMLDTLNFVAIAHRPGTEFSKEDAAQYFERAANKIDLGQLCGDEAESVEYKLALDANAIQDSSGTGYRAIMCVPVSRDLFEHNLSLAMMQGKAAAKIAESMKVDSSAETKH